MSAPTADRAHLRPRQPEMTHLWLAKASSRNQAELCRRATPSAIPAHQPTNQIRAMCSREQHSTNQRQEPRSCDQLSTNNITCGAWNFRTSDVDVATLVASSQWREIVTKKTRRQTISSLPSSEVNLFLYLQTSREWRGPAPPGTRVQQPANNNETIHVTREKTRDSRGHHDT